MPVNTFLGPFELVGTRPQMTAPDAASLVSSWVACMTNSSSLVSSLSANSRRPDLIIVWLPYQSLNSSRPRWINAISAVSCLIPYSYLLVINNNDFLVPTALPKENLRELRRQRRSSAADPGVLDEAHESGPTANLDHRKGARGRPGFHNPKILGYECPR